MARNSEKQYGRLNRFLLSKEREEYEKSHPKRPNLNTLNTVEEMQKWLPGIKDDMNFYLMKSQVICYSDEHIEECNQKVVHLEKEYKAFVRKIKQLTSGTLEAVPWTNRAYKRKHFDSVELPSAKKEFTPILTPILDQEPKTQEKMFIPVSLPLMNEPLTFVCDNKKTEKSSTINTSSISISETQLHTKPCFDRETSNCQPLLNHMGSPLILESNSKKINTLKQKLSPDVSLSSSDYEQYNKSIMSNFFNKSEKSIVNYESSSDSES